MHELDKTNSRRNFLKLLTLFPFAIPLAACNTPPQKQTRQMEPQVATPAAANLPKGVFQTDTSQEIRALQTEKVLGFSEYIDYDGGVVVNEHPQLKIQVSQDLLNFLYNHPLLGARLPKGHLQFFVIFAEKDNADLLAQHEKFKNERIQPMSVAIFASKYPGQFINLNLKSLPFNNVAIKEKLKKPKESNAELLQGVSEEIVLNWYSALRSSVQALNPTKNINPNKIDDPVGILLIAKNPFHIVSV